MDFSEVSYLYIILAIVIIVAVVILVLISKKTGKEELKKEININSIDVEKNEKYMFLKELAVYEYIASFLPNEYIIFPKVELSLLIKPTNTKHAYNEIKGKVVDFVIFEKANMNPVLVLDCYDTTYSNGMLEELEPFVVKVLQKAKLELLTIHIKNQLNKDEIQKSILEKLEKNI